MKKNKLKFKVHAVVPFSLKGEIDTESTTTEGAIENAEILYEVLCRRVSAATFLHFMKKLQSKTGIFFNPSKRDHT